MFLGNLLDKIKCKTRGIQNCHVDSLGKLKKAVLHGWDSPSNLGTSYSGHWIFLPSDLFFFQYQAKATPKAIDKMKAIVLDIKTPGLVSTDSPDSEWIISSGAMVAESRIQNKISVRGHSYIDRVPYFHQ